MYETVVVPLDGSELAEAAAEAKQRALVRRQMRKHLSEVEESFRDRGISVSLSVRSGFPAGEILSCGRRSRVDIIAMSTHGRGYRHLRW